jgi:hypothetical protein
VLVRVAIPVAVLSASGNKLPGLPRYEYAGLTGDATGFYAATREFIAAWGKARPARRSRARRRHGCSGGRVAVRAVQRSVTDLVAVEQTDVRQGGGGQEQRSTERRRDEDGTAARRGIVLTR